MTLGVSIIICCFNSAKRLPATLKHLALQVVPENIPWEVIVVNNASSDETAIVAKEEWSKYRLPQVGFRILEQNIPGKNYAFKVGIEEAKYEFILTCDDDNWLFPDYIFTAYDIMQSDMNIGVLGGSGIFEPELPLNIEIEEFKRLYVNGPQNWVSKEHWVYGAGSVCRKSILTDLMNKKWSLITPGRIGNKLNGGEDVEICLMSYLIGYKIEANDNLLFKHFVPLKRQSTDYIVNLSFWLSYTNVLLNSYYTILNNDKRPLKKNMNDWFLNISKALAKQLILYSYKNLKTWKKPTIAQKISLQSTWGTFCSLLKNRKKMIDHHHQIKEILFHHE